MIEKKWNAFGRRKLIQSLLGYTIYLFSFCMALVSRAPNPPKDIDFYKNETYFPINEHLYMDAKCFLWSYTDSPGSLMQKVRIT